MKWLLGFALFFVNAPALAQPTDIVIAVRAERDGTQTLQAETTIDAPAADLWAAISTPEGWRTWAVPAAWATAGGIETSYTAAARPGDPTTIWQHFMAALPGRILVFRTVRAPAGFPHFDTFSRTVSFFELVPEGERRTRVRLTMTGYADTEAGRQLLGFFREGNRVSLDRLRRRFASGPLDWSRESR